MSHEALTQDEAGADDLLEKKPSGPSKVVVLLAALVGVGVGGWYGAPLVTPTVAEMMAPSGEDDGGGYGGGGYGEGGAEVADEPLLIGNLVLNPANSGGTRFLVAALSLGSDPDARAELESRDAEARDLLLMILSSRTVDELSDISLRDEIREDLRSALNTMLGYDGVHRIFLPQFVIQ